MKVFLIITGWCASVWLAFKVGFRICQEEVVEPLLETIEKDEEDKK